MRRFIVITLLSIFFIGIVGLFWRNEWMYSLPTPVPDNYKIVKPGSIIDISVKFAQDNTKPLFLHFFNPDCPCSRFNMVYFKSLAKQYGNRVNFGIVVLNNRDYTAREIQDKFNLEIPVSFDSAIAVSCGVYSTPQAVIIDTGHKLYYRGNYNRTRYCTDGKTNYAQIALEGLLNGDASLIFDPLALTAYGCRLPTCTK
jgi:hypothetical protein